ncbi:MAG: hypothetical protein JNG85_14685 [Spirochaetaceae bacterium]|nr:hypothetical protein [Spirochaetaceae bacterium]
MKQDEAMRLADDGIARVEKKIEGFKAEIESVSAPVASDAQELAESALQIFNGPSNPRVWEDECSQLVALIERYAAERERKAREEERERCIARIRWMDNPLDPEDERDVIAAIKESGNGN